YLSTVADSATGYFLMRFFTGFALATFVSTQYWMSSMFSPRVVDQANGQAAGWGKLGEGVAQFVVVLNIRATPFSAWRISFYIPALFQMSSAFATMFFGQDLPDGNFHQLQKSGNMHKDNASKVLYHGVTNYRSWITTLGYRFCFRVELAVNNIVAYYFYDWPIGGGLSYFSARKFGMRGRLWRWWIVQGLSSVLCIILGRLNTLSASIAVMIVFSVFVQAAQGLTFGIVPFISRRSSGVVSGMTRAGGNVASIYFPQWGDMICGPKANSTEEEYYLKELDSKEQEQGLHQVSMRLAESYKNERSNKGKSTPDEGSTIGRF
ncbi:High affinity nitrate transporter 2.5, partial [Bienertia sinuspersici]